MSETSIMNLLQGQGPWAILFFFLLIFILKEYSDNKKQSQAREDKLMEHIQKSDEHISKSDETNSKIAEKVEKISENMIHMQDTLGAVQKDIDDLKGR